MWRRINVSWRLCKWRVHVQLFACLHWRTLWNRSVPHLVTFSLYCGQLLFPQQLSTAGHYLWSVKNNTTTSTTSITTIQQLRCSLDFSKSESCRNLKFTFVGDKTCAGAKVGANNAIIQRSKSLGAKQNNRPFPHTFVKSRSIYSHTKTILWELYTSHWIHFTCRSVIFALFACSVCRIPTVPHTPFVQSEFIWWDCFKSKELQVKVTGNENDKITYTRSQAVARIAYRSASHQTI